VKRWAPEGSIVVLTGASSGIGYNLALLLAGRGATVFAVARRESRLNSLVENGRDAPGRIVSFVGDITSEETRRGVLQMASEAGEGRLDLLVNNAGIGAIGPFAEASSERLRRIMDVNFLAPAELSRAAIPLLRKGRNPVLCNIGSVLGHRAVPDKSEYCASKFAMHGWSDSVRGELTGDGIQVTLVSPSTTESEFFDSVIETSPVARSRSIGSWSARRVARAALAAVIARRAEVILSLGGKALVYGDRFAPPLMNRLLRKGGT
jgi:short-subunit dehydrogenase